jgi:hypothetical protein
MFMHNGLTVTGEQMPEKAAGEHLLRSPIATHI